MTNETIVTFEEIYKAYIDCRKRKKNKSGAKKFEINAFFNISNIVNEINNRKYKLRPAQCFIVKDPTLREVFCADFRDRVVQHFVYNELNPYIDKKLIFDAANCRKEKGTDFAIDRVKRFVRSATNNYQNEAYYLKMDLSGFFMKIDRQLLLKIVYNVIDNDYHGTHKETLKYLTKIIITTDVTKNATRLSPLSDWEKLPKRKTLFGNKNGLPIGNICSQIFANLYLNDLDHKIKSRHKYYSRYVDDMIILDNDKHKLIETMQIVDEYIPLINLELSYRKTLIKPCSYGINYLGVTIKPYYTKLGISRINRIYSKLKQINSPKSLIQRYGSRKGMFKRYKGYNLQKRLFNKIDIKIRKNIVLTNMKLKILAK